MAIGNLKAENYLPVVKFNQGYKSALPISTTSTLTAASATFTSGITGQNFSVSFTGQTTEAATDRVIFIAPVACQVVSAREVHAVAAGGASTLQLTKDTGTTAPGAGTDLLSAAFDLNATANTVQTGALTSTTADLQLAAGDRLSIDFANAIQSTAGLGITVWLKTI